MVVVVVEWKLRHGPGVVAATRRRLRELVSRRRRSPRAGRGRVADRWDVVHPRRRRRTQPRRRRRRRRGAARAAAAPEERPRRDAVAEVGRHRPEAAPPPVRRLRRGRAGVHRPRPGQHHGRALLPRGGRSRHPRRRPLHLSGGAVESKRAQPAAAASAGGSSAAPRPGRLPLRRRRGDATRRVAPGVAAAHVGIVLPAAARALRARARRDVADLVVVVRRSRRALLPARGAHEPELQLKLVQLHPQRGVPASRHLSLARAREKQRETNTPVKKKTSRSPVPEPCGAAPRGPFASYTRLCAASNKTGGILVRGSGVLVLDGENGQNR